MRIRNQLVLAFVFLAIVPLAVIVVVSYLSSERAVRRTVQSEASRLTTEMEERLAEVDADLRRRVENLGALPFRRLVSGGVPSGEDAQVLFGRLLGELGDAAEMVETVELVPAAPPFPPSPPPAEPAPTPTPGPAPEATASRSEHEALVISVPDLLGELKALEELEALGNREGSDPETGEEIEETAADVGKESLAEVIALSVKLAEEVTAGVAGETARSEEEQQQELERRVREIEARELEAQGKRLERLAMRQEERHRKELERQLATRLKVMEQRRVIFDRLSKAITRHPRIPEASEVPETSETPEIPEGRPPAGRTPVSDGPEERDPESSSPVGTSFDVPVHEAGEVVGAVRARISAQMMLRRILGLAQRGQGEIPFAIDAEGQLHTIEDADLTTIESLVLPAPEAGDADSGPDGGSGTEGTVDRDDWVVVKKEVPELGVTFGIARPIRESLEEVRKNALRNLAFGLALIGLALFGIHPLSKRITRDLDRVTIGARRIAQGDLQTRVPVKSKNELGQLARAFNHMALELSEHQERLLREESRRREQELRERLLQAEYERKSRELEEARSFQLSLLPKTLPRHPAFEIAVDMRTATEVGGDYYDFHLRDDVLTLAIGDATGHGARAGTMVTVIKSLFSAAGDMDLPAFLTRAHRSIKRMELGRMAMALTLARLDGASLRLAAAGMPPVLIHRGSTSEVEEIALEGMPLGGLDFPYREIAVAVDPGDTVLLLSDGFPELLDPAGEPLGYPRVREEFEAVAGRSPSEIVHALGAAAVSWTAGQPPQDDVTFVVLRLR